MAYTANDENTLKREISSLRKIKDTYPKYLLTTDFDSANIDGIRKINVIDWLLESKA
jgi:predicted AAA+ superfamily ATPase